MTREEKHKIKHQLLETQVSKLEFKMTRMELENYVFPKGGEVTWLRRQENYVINDKDQEICTLKHENALLKKKLTNFMKAYQEVAIEDVFE